MSKQGLRFPAIAGALVASLATVASYSSAMAQDLDRTISCVGGQVESFDYAELEENFREGVWDKRAGVQLVSESEQVTLMVIDETGASICEQVADLRTRCQFQLRTNSFFSIRVDNSNNSVFARYKLCAY